MKKHIPMYNSQFGEDEWIDKNAPLPEKGVFVDVGAGDPKRFSNTRFFEDKGWDGVCIDANPIHYAELLRERGTTFYAVVRSYNGISPFSISENPDYSRIGKEVYKGKTIQAPCFTLNAILMHFRVRHIDILSLDVEGAELEVLEGFSLEHYKPTIIIIEYKTIGLSNNDLSYTKYFENTPYKLVHKTDANFIFYRQ